MITRRPQHKPRATRSKRSLILPVLLVLILAGGFFSFNHFSKKTDTPQQVSKTNEVSQEPQKPEEPKVVLPPIIDLQPTVDAWVAKQSADYGIEVFDVANQTVIASHQADKGYFTASIYKLYVAYFTYQKMQAGEVQDVANYLGAQSKLDCLHETIYTSDSPCGEKLMADLTQKVMHDSLIAYGAVSTGFPKFETSAHDVNLVLNRIALKKDLNEEYTSKLLTSMTTQIYNKGITKGFAGATVADKVGFNENLNYHDAGLVTLADGRQYLVSIFSQGQGSPAPHASLSAALNAKLTE